MNFLIHKKPRTWTKEQKTRFFRNTLFYTKDFQEYLRTPSKITPEEKQLIQDALDTGRVTIQTFPPCPYKLLPEAPRSKQQLEQIKTPRSAKQYVQGQRDKFEATAKEKRAIREAREGSYAEKPFTVPMLKQIPAKNCPLARISPEMADRISVRLKVYTLFCKGYSYIEIAKNLSMTYNTAYNYTREGKAFHDLGYTMEMLSLVQK
jgi:hypothetical protein